ncbi:hypothetical protein KSD_78550 [Ktedonobacter sp. SOSP1-85]|nr:hypothetical protein KSD_78550 [Ktedonobacter sp. SOSP1-85]
MGASDHNARETPKFAESIARAAVLIVSEKERREIMSFSDHLSPREAARAFTLELMALKRHFDDQIPGLCTF